jgi:hypothetical protein
MIWEECNGEVNIWLAAVILLDKTLAGFINFA